MFVKIVIWCLLSSLLNIHSLHPWKVIEFAISSINTLQHGVSLYTIVKSEFFYDDFGLNEFSVIDDLIDTCSVIIARQRKLLIKMLFDLKIFRKR